jgi:Transposase IS66 family
LGTRLLKDLKQRLQDWRHTLLTCLVYEGIPADNNKAERHLRKLVLKRKKSFGVRNLKTARTLSTLMSVVWTYKHRYQQQPERLLPALAQLVRE